MNPTLRKTPLVLVLAAVGCSAEETADRAAPPVEVLEVSEQELIRGSFFIASIRSNDSAEVRPQVTGRITSIAVRSGQTVERGTVLMSIDQSRQRAAVNVAQAASQVASADLARARADLSALEASRKAQRAELDYQRKQLDRVRRLFAADNVSRDEFERASADLESAEARLAAIDAQIKSQRASIRAYQSTLEQRSSQVDQGQAELQYYNVVAGVAGKLGDIPVRVGDLVTSNTLLTTVEGSSTRELLVHVPMEKAPLLRPGLQVEVRNGRNRLIETLRIDFVSPSVDQVTQTILAKASIPTGSALTPGQFVRARVIWERLRGPAVPTTAVLRINTQPYVFRLKDGPQGPTVSQIPVELGLLESQRYLVDRGIEVGDRVVVKGIQRLRDGGPVEITRTTTVTAEAS